MGGGSDFAKPLVGGGDTMTGDANKGSHYGGSGGGGGNANAGNNGGGYPGNTSGTRQMKRVACPSCGASWLVTQHAAKHDLHTCPNCQTQFYVPRTEWTVCCCAIV